MTDILDFFLEGEIIVRYKPKRPFSKRLKYQILKRVYPYVRYLSDNFPIPFIGELRDRLDSELIPPAVQDAKHIIAMRHVLQQLGLKT